jgi:hypothetical protein
MRPPGSAVHAQKQKNKPNTPANNPLPRAPRRPGPRHLWMWQSGTARTNPTRQPIRETKRRPPELQCEFCFRLSPVEARFQRAWLSEVR